MHPFLAERCKSFFTDILKLTEPDHYEYFKKEIEKRYAEELSIINASDEEYIKDVKTVLKYLDTHEYTGDLKGTLSKLYFIQCKTDNGTVYVNPHRTTVYFDKSNENVSIKDYFAFEDGVHFIDMDFYIENGIDRKSLKLLGVKDTLIENREIRGWYESGEGNTQWCDVDDFRSKLEFIGIDSAIAFIQNNPESEHAKEKSRIIMQLLFATEKHLAGEIIKGKGAQNRVKAHAKVIKVLTEGRWSYKKQRPKWLFDKNGRIVNPAEISKYDLNIKIYGNVKRDSNIYNILGFACTQKDETEEAFASILNLDEESQDSILMQLLIEKLKRQPLQVEEIIKMCMASEGACCSTNDIEDECFDPYAKDLRYGFPLRPVKNLETLKKSVEWQYFSAPEVRYELRERSVRISEDKERKHSYLKDMYSSEYNPLIYICQMCQKPRSYFEAVQIEKEPRLELSQMHMLLCPNCAAYYKGMRNDALLIANFITELCEADESQDEPVCVPIGYETIFFTATHIAEIKEIQRLNASSKEKHEEGTGVMNKNIV